MNDSMAVISILRSYLVIPFDYRLVLVDLNIWVFFLWIAVLSIAPLDFLFQDMVQIINITF
jgi:hypothetical protein